jgi:hypothetical protein
VENNAGNVGLGPHGIRRDQNNERARTCSCV